MKTQKGARKQSLEENNAVALGEGAAILSNHRGPSEWHTGTHIRMVE